MSTDTKIIIILLAVCYSVFSTTWHWFRAKLLLNRWARANGFELVQMSIPWFKFSPFFLVSKQQEVYEMVVRDDTGQERHGWAKCGGFFLGFFVDQVEVEWD